MTSEESRSRINHNDRQQTVEHLNINDLDVVRVSAPLLTDDGKVSGTVLGGEVKDPDTGDIASDKRFVAIGKDEETKLAIVDVSTLEEIIGCEGP